MRVHDWTGFAALGAAIVGAIALASGALRPALGWFAVAAAAGVVTRYWSRTRPGPMPHLLRWTLLVPRGNQSAEHLKRILEPRSGERMLEIGPGIGIHALYLACRDPRVPWHAKALAGCVTAYAFSPIDLIPDFIPILGYVDDLIVVPLGVRAARRLVPADVLADCRARAATIATETPVTWIGTAIVVTIWIGASSAAGACWWLASR